MKTFYIRDALGNQAAASIAIITSPAQAKQVVSTLPNGRYTVRDCLGGLRMVLVVQDGEAKVLEATR
jgi:hypothetical protein